MLAAVVLVACGGGESKVRLSVNERLAAGDYAGALVQLKALVQAQPEAAYARALLGQALLQTGDVPGAELELRRAAKGGHAADEVVPALARALLLQGKAQALVVEFGSTPLATPAAKAQLAVTLAQGRQSLGQSGAALDALTRTLAETGPQVGLLVMDARLRADLGRAAEAQTLAKTLVEQFPQAAEVWLLQGDSLSVAGDMPGATAAYEKALAIDGKLAAAHAALVQQALAEGRLELARERIQRMAKALPGLGQTLYFEALADYNAGQFERARTRLQPLLRGPVAPPLVLRLAGLVEQRLGALEQSQALLSRAAAALPQSAPVARELAAVLGQLGRPDRALDLLEPLLASAAADAATWTAVGQARSQLGRFKAADQAYAKARALKPQDDRLRAEMARSQLSRGDAEHALRELQTVSAGPDGAPATAELISAHMRKGQTAAALKAAEALVQQRPAAALSEVLRGHVLEARGERPAARLAYERAIEKEPTFFAAVDSLAELDRRDGQSARARERYESHLKRQPNSAPALLALAEQLRRDGAPADTVRIWLDKAVATQGGDAATWQEALAQEARLGDRQALLERAKRAVAALPERPELLLALSEAHRAVGATDEALRTLQRLVTAQPRSAPVRLLLAEAQLNLSNPAAARRQVNEALDLDPRSLAVVRAHAMLLLREGKTDPALAVAQQALTNSPTDPEALRLLAEVHSARGEHGAAVRPLREALVLRREPALARQLAMALRAGSDATAADRFERDWMRSEPADLDFLAQAAQSADGRGDSAAAEALYRQLIARTPDAALAMNNLAQLLITRRPAEALELAQRATRLVPDSPPLLDTLAQAQMARGDLERALQTQKTVVQLDGMTGEFRITLARIHAAAGRKEEALREIRRLADRGQGYASQESVKRLLKELGG